VQHIRVLKCFIYLGQIHFNISSWSYHHDGSLKGVRMTLEMIPIDALAESAVIIFSRQIAERIQVNKHDIK